MDGLAEMASGRMEDGRAPSFVDWTLREVDRLAQAREVAADSVERARYELELAILCDAARRFGAALEEAAEL